MIEETLQDLNNINRMDILDKYKKQYIILDDLEIKFIYQYFDILNNSNSSIEVLDLNFQQSLIKVRTIRSLTIYSSDKIIVRII